MPEIIECPICHTDNEPKSQYCHVCGAFIATVPSTGELNKDAEVATVKKVTTGKLGAISSSKMVICTIQHSQQAIPLHLKEGLVITFGRRVSIPISAGGAAESKHKTILRRSEESRNLLAMVKQQQKDKQQQATAAKVLIDLNLYKGSALGISREHASLSLNNELLRVSDLGSTNGTYLNGKAIAPHQTRLIRDGDMLQLGGMQILIKFTPDK